MKHGSKLFGGGCMNENAIHGALKKGETEWSTGFFPPKKADMFFFAKKNKSFARAPYLRETIYPCQK